MNRIATTFVLSVGLGLGFGLAILSQRPPAEVLAEPRLPVIPKEFTSYRDIVKRVVPGVVSIEAKGKVAKKSETGSKSKDDPIGFGSGAIIDSKGVIVTNFHVVDGAESVEVYLPDGRKFSSKDIHIDRKTDLAVIRVTSDKPLPFLEFGDSDGMEVGDRVLAVGAPFGLTGSVTHGIISAKSRSLRLNQYEDFLQTDAAINPGNSGGPLVNLEGQIIGINSAIKSKSGGFQGVGLAISSKLVKSVVNQLLKEGSIKRGYLGVQIKEIDVTLGEKLGVKEGAGVVVTGVFKNSPAEKAGVKLADVIQNIGGKELRDGEELSKIVAALPIGQPIEFRIVRGGKAMAIKVTIAEQPDEFGN